MGKEILVDSSIHCLAPKIGNKCMDFIAYQFYSPNYCYRFSLTFCNLPPKQFSTTIPFSIQLYSSCVSANIFCHSANPCYLFNQASLKEWGFYNVLPQSVGLPATCGIRECFKWGIHVDLLDGSIPCGVLIKKAFHITQQEKPLKTKSTAIK